jgi:transposase
LHVEELYNSHPSQNIVRMIKSRRAGLTARMRVKRSAYKVLVGNVEGRRLLGRSRRKRVYKLKWAKDYDV